MICPIMNIGNTENIQIAERTCPSCKEPTFYDLGDYDACPCGKTTKPQLFSEMSPEEVLNNLEEVPF